MRDIRLIQSFQSYQGEGPDSGKKMIFLRFKRCSRKCKFCDSQVLMRVSNEFEMSIKEIQSIVDEYKTNICITGGEPLFNNNLLATIDIVNSTKCNLYNIETNGLELEKAIAGINKNKNVKYILSPKIFDDNDYTFYESLVKNIKDNEKVHIKLVYEGTEYNNKFLDYLQEINFDNNRIWLMSEGATREDLIKNSPKVFDAAEKYKTNFSSRDHVIFGFV